MEKKTTAAPEEQYPQLYSQDASMKAQVRLAAG